MVRYYRRHAKELLRLAQCLDALAISAAIRGMGERPAIADHPLSPKLFIEEMLIAYAALRLRQRRPVPAPMRQRLLSSSTQQAFCCRPAARRPVGDAA